MRRDRIGRLYLIRRLAQELGRTCRIGSLDVNLPHRQGEDEPQLQVGQLLADAVPRPHLERAVSVLGRVQGVALGDGETLRVEDVGVGPEGRVAVARGRGGEEHEALGGEALAGLGDGDEEVLDALAVGAGDGEEAEDLLDEGDGVGHLVEEAGVGGDAGRRLVGVPAEDVVVLGADALGVLGVLGQHVVAVGQRGGGGVVAGEEEGLDVVDDLFQEGRGDVLAGGVVGALDVGLEGQLHDGAGPLVLLEVEGGVGDVGHDGGAEAAVVEPVVVALEGVEALGGLDVEVDVADLGEHGVEEGDGGLLLGAEAGVEDGAADDVDGDAGGVPVQLDDLARAREALELGPEDEGLLDEGGHHGPQVLHGEARVEDGAGGLPLGALGGDEVVVAGQGLEGLLQPVVLGLVVVLGELGHHVRVVDGEDGRRRRPQVEVARALGRHLGVQLRDEDGEAVAVGVCRHLEMGGHLLRDAEVAEQPVVREKFLFKAALVYRSRL